MSRRDRQDAGLSPARPRSGGSKPSDVLAPEADALSCRPPLEIFEKRAAEFRRVPGHLMSTMDAVP